MESDSGMKVKRIRSLPVICAGYEEAAHVCSGVDENCR